MPDLARNITIDYKAGKVHVDGIEFPWYIVERGPDIDGLDDPTSVTVVHLPVFAESVDITPRDDEA